MAAPVAVEEEYIVTQTTKLAEQLRLSSDVEKAAQIEDSSSYNGEAVVDFDGDDDPKNPLNWSKSYRWFLVILTSLMTTIVTLATVVCAPAVPQILQDFNSDNSYDAIILVSVWEIGEIVGPLFLAPMSELYGRLPVWHVSSVLFVVCSIAAALSTSLNMMIAFRFLNGVACPIVLSSAIVSDLFRLEERGRGLTIASLAPLIGPTFGPAIGGYISQNAGWQWTYWFVAIVSAVVELLLLIFLRETYAVKLLDTKARRLVRETGKQGLKSKYDKNETVRALFLRAFARPLKFLLLSPIVTMMSLYLGVIYGYLYLILTTLTEVLEDTYHFSAGSAGLSFLGMGLGLAAGSIFCYFLLDSYVKKKAAQGCAKPEDRLPILLLGSFIMPAGLFLYGWTAEKAVHWIVPIIGTGFIGLGLMVTSIPIRTYLVDAYTLHSASAVAAGIFFRSITGAVLPLAGPPLYAALSLGWGNSLLGFIALAFVPVPVLFYKHGEWLRMRFPMEM